MGKNMAILVIGPLLIMASPSYGITSDNIHLLPSIITSNNAATNLTASANIQSNTPYAKVESVISHTILAQANINHNNTQVKTSASALKRLQSGRLAPHSSPIRQLPGNVGPRAGEPHKTCEELGLCGPLGACHVCED